MTLERCLDPSPTSRLALAGDDIVGEGDYVIAAPEAGGAQVVQRLADGGSMLARIYAIAVNHQLDPLFPAGVSEEVELLLKEPGIQEPSLADLTSLPFCTIDGPSTRDLDQALHVVATATGFQLSYALADASWFVRPGSALFGAAVHRASSFYLPGLVIPMLPRELSEGLCSLNPGVDRRALVMVLDLDREGRVMERGWVRARIRSRAKLAFDEIPSLLAERDTECLEPGLSASLHAFRDLGQVLVARRARAGVVRYRRDEVDLTITPGGHGLRALRSIDDPVERWNEEVSVLCNTEGARWLTEGDTERDGIEPIYRVHPAPPKSAMRRLERRIAGIVALHGLDPEVWSWQLGGPRTLAAYLDSLPREGEAGRQFRRAPTVVSWSGSASAADSTFGGSTEAAIAGSSAWSRKRVAQCLAADTFCLFRRWPTALRSRRRPCRDEPSIHRPADRTGQAMYTLLIAFFLIAIVTSFLCSLWEAVLLSITPSYAQIKMQEQSRLGTRLQRFKENIDRPLAAILTLNTIAHTVGAIGVGDQASKIWADANPLITGLVVSVVMTLAILIRAARDRHHHQPAALSLGAGQRHHDAAHGGGVGLGSGDDRQLLREEPRSTLLPHPALRERLTGPRRRLHAKGRAVGTTG
jgi:hypothetical protein